MISFEDFELDILKILNLGGIDPLDDSVDSGHGLGSGAGSNFKTLLTCEKCPGGK